MAPKATTCRPSFGSKRTRRMRVRNSTQRSCAPSSLSVKYAWPEPYTLKLETSPSTHTAGKRSSITALSCCDSAETVKTVRSATDLAGRGEQGVAHQHGDGHET